jgi:hypothetical protein
VISTATRKDGQPRSPRSSASDRTGIREQYKAQRKPDADGRLISTLVGSGAPHPDHGTFTGADWYHCECVPCRTALAERPNRNVSLRAWRSYNKDQRKKQRFDGKTVWVSMLLGMPGEPEHGTATGYRDYACRCPECSGANTVHMRTYRQRYTPAAKAVAPVLTDYWPGQPKSGDVNRVAGLVSEAWAEHKRATTTHKMPEAIQALLAEEAAWQRAGTAKIAQAVTVMVERLEAPRVSS